MSPRPPGMQGIRRVLAGGAVAAALCACAREGDVAYRGANLEVAQLSVADLVAVYRAALGGPFTLGDPNLSLLMDTLFLPRGTGLAGGSPVPAEVLSAMRDAGLTRGTCSVPVARSREPLVCPAARAGYAIRLSQPYALGQDSVQVHVVVEQYAIPYGPRAERLRFERAYHVVKRGTAWRAAREARLPQP